MTIIQADILQWAEEYDGEPFHAALLDPPYGLNENEIDIQAVLADWLADREHRPKGAGFMGREWDSFIPGPRIWRAIRERCYPGALLMAFGGTRTADLLGLALRLGGWEKVDEIDWVYGSGFPKNHNISKAIDKAARAERPVIGTRKHQPKFDAAGFEYRKKDNGYNSKGRESFDVTAAATDMARAWEGYGTAFKPAHEPILVFRNPFRGTYAANCTRTGAGALNVDGGRIGRAAGDRFEYGVDGDEQQTTGDSGIYGHFAQVTPYEPHSGGRWPANLLLSHTPACRAVGTRRVKGASGWSASGSKATSNTAMSGPNYERSAKPDAFTDADGYETVTAWACAEGCPVAALDRQSGVLTSSSGKPFKRSGTSNGYDGGWGAQDVPGFYGDSGGASRFFHQSDWSYEIEERIAAADPVRYCAKAGRTEREMGLDPDMIKLLSDLYGSEVDSFEEDTIDDGREKSIDNPYQRGETSRRNIHPTVKPIALNFYLAKLLLPPAEYAPRRLLIPFAGVASEYLGAMFAGWEEIIGVELEAQHCRIAEARIRWWQTMQRQTHSSDPGAILKTYGTMGKTKPSSPERWPAGSLFESLEVE